MKGSKENVRMNIYIGNISYNASEADIQSAFEAFGQVESITIIKDRFTGKSKGFGFVEMPDDEEARKAIAEMDGKDLVGRDLKVNEARPRNRF